MEAPFKIIRPKSTPRPIVVSCPHSGTQIPADILQQMDHAVASQLDDTDWFVHDLYSFAQNQGITLIHATYSRYVVDLNRDPSGRKLYADARSETTLVPKKTFGGESLYDDLGPNPKEIERRVKVYYDPYHGALRTLLHELRRSHGHVLLWDAHSIKRAVPSVRPEPFADMILGDQMGKTASPLLTQAALKSLRGSEVNLFDVQHNHPFMGGYITRYFGQSAPGIHALQLEMSQDIYMDQDGRKRDAIKESNVANVLASTLIQLSKVLASLP
jgi:N-formylglutamate deformylase